MKAKINNLFIPNIVYVLTLGLVVRFFLSFFGTLQLDQGTFIAWSTNLAKNGFSTFYNSWSDYLPGYLYVLWLLGKINLLGIIPQVLLYKIPAILADLVTGYLIYRILGKTKSERWALIGASSYIFNPAILGNSALWGQADSLTALTSLLAVYFFESFPYVSAVFLSVGTLIKPQTAFILPVIIFLTIKDKWKFSKFLLYGLTSLAIFVLGFLPFAQGENLPAFIFERLNVSLNQYPYTSVNAFNFWGILGFWKADMPVYQYGGYVLFILVIIFLSYKLWKEKNAKYLLLTVAFSFSFLFFTRIHERHLLPVFAPLAIAAIENPILLIPYLGFSLIYVANLYYSYVSVSDNFRQAFPEIVLKFFSVLNVALGAFILFVVARKFKLKWNNVFQGFNKLIARSHGKIKEYKLPPMNLSKKTVKILLGIILGFTFVTRVFGLGSPPGEYFDEVYHAFTAKVILHNDAKAWEWWNTPPEGFAYEWTHPPLAKLGMWVGMKILGENSFGWRIPGAILGVGSVFLIYLLAKLLFKDELTGLLSAAVFGLDGLPLVISRIGMNDSYLLFFSLLSILLLLNKKDFWSAISFGLALASKWSAIWAIPILGIIWLWRKNKFTKSLFWFLVLPVVIYLLTYLPMFLSGHDFSVWWGMQKQMWWYHTGLKATHPYSSPWWSWPFLIRPIYLYTSDEISGMVSRIYAMGNPLIFWFGLASVFMSLAYAFIEKNKKLGLIVFSYLIFFVPWAASPRIMFIYHYLPSIPFLAIATGYVLRRNQKLILPFMIFSLSLFIYFYPHWAGLNIPLWLDKSYYWIGSWR